MKTILLSILFVLLSFFQATAKRSLQASKSFSEYRSQGELRVWTYIIKDSVIGQLTSKVTGTEEIDGVTAYILQEKLYLDYNKIGSPVLLDISGKRYVSERGAYLGDDTKVTINKQPSEIHLRKSGERVTGYFTRGKDKLKQERKLSGNPFGIDNDYFDQYELYFAMHDIQVGDTIDDSIFVPQTMLMAHLSGEVAAFSFQQLHRTLFDSVFVIKLTEPQPLELFLNTNRRLLKINNHNQNLRVYLDVIQEEPAGNSIKKTFTLSKFINLLPTYILIFVIGAIIRFFLVGGKYRWLVSWYALLIGILAYIIIVFIQFPFQSYFFKHWFVPLTASGKNIYLSVFLVLIPTGIFQEGLKLLGLILCGRWGKLTPTQFITIGGLVGLGVGLGEGWYLSSILTPDKIISGILLERISMIIFHTITGVLLGYAWGSRNTKQIVSSFAVLALINTGIRSLPIFVQQRVVETQLMYVILSITVVVLLLGAMILLKRSKPHK